MRVEPRPSARAVERGWRYRGAALAAFIGLLASLAAYRFVAQLDRQLEEANFATRAQGELAAIQLRMGNYNIAVQSLAKFFEASDQQIGVSQFDLFSQSLLDEFPGIASLTWHPRVTRDQRAAFEAMASATVKPGYEITDDETSGNPVRAGDREEYFPTLFRTKEPGYERDLGFDSSFDPARAATVRQAIDSGRPVATGPLRLVPIGPEIPWGYLIYDAVYRRDFPQGTVEERRAAIKGYVVASVRAEPSLAAILRLVAAPADLDFYFFNGAGRLDDRLLYWGSPAAGAVGPAPRESELRAGPHWEGTLKVFDRDLGLLIVPARPLPSGYRGMGPLLVLSASLMMTGTLALYLFGTARRTFRLEALTARLQAATQKLGFSNLLLASATENSPGCILILSDKDETILVNTQLKKTLNLASDAAIPADAASWRQLVQSQVKNVAEFLEHTQKLTANPAAVAHDELEFKDGRVFDRYSCRLSDAGGTNLGRIWFLRDITGRKRATDALRRHNALLDAVTMSVATLLTRRSLSEAVPVALAYIGNVVNEPCIVVIERMQEPDGRHRHRLAYQWTEPELPHWDLAEVFENYPPDLPELAAWYAPLGEGKTVVTTRETATPTVKEIMGDAESLLFVPIFADATWWGYLSLGGHDVYRARDEQEVALLQTLGNLIGAAIARERREKALSDANRIVENSSTILYRLSAEPAMPLIYISENVARLGYDAAQLIADPQRYKSYVHPDDLPKILRSQSEVLGPNPQPTIVEYRVRTAAGAYRWVEAHSNLIRDAGGRVVEVEGILVDVTEHKEAEATIAVLARTDPLTGLANRRTFLERLDQAFAATRRGASAFAVLSLDLDHFKEINDMMGHPTGDLLLAAIAERLRKTVRQTDMVARFGGDEFMVLQTDMGEPASAGALAEKIRKAIALPVPFGEVMLQSTASIGISISSPDIDGAEAMIAQADVALYRAKDEGRDRYRFHSEEMTVEVRERLAMTEDLRLAVINDELELDYQPTVELATGRIVGVEALVRWNRPGHGRLMPASFLPTAERTGTIVQLGRWVLRQACRQMQLWRAAGIAPPVMTVNLSLGQMKAGDGLIEDVTANLSEFGVAATSLEFDVTEATLAGLAPAQLGVLERLRALGVGIALDDFGSMLSSLNCIRRHHLDHLKISLPYVQAATSDLRSAAAISAIAGMARDLDIGVIAEGVETDDQRALLMSIAPRMAAQGFLFTGPLNAEDATEALRRRIIAGPAAARAPDRLAAKR